MNTLSKTIKSQATITYLFNTNTFFLPGCLWASISTSMCSTMIALSVHKFIILILMSVLLSIASSKSPGKSNPSTDVEANKLHHYTCINQAGKDDIQPIWISYSNDAKENIGILETPNFPDRFPLPLRCVWIFNNTEPLHTATKKIRSNLYIYFTRVRQYEEVCSVHTHFHVLREILYSC